MAGPERSRAGRKTMTDKDRLGIRKELLRIATAIADQLEPAAQAEPGGQPLAVLGALREMESAIAIGQSEAVRIALLDARTRGSQLTIDELAAAASLTVDEAMQRWPAAVA